MWHSTSLFCCLAFTCYEVLHDPHCTYDMLAVLGLRYTFLNPYSQTTTRPRGCFEADGRADLFRAKSFLQHVPLCVARRCRHLGKQGRHSRDRHGAAEHSFRPNQTNLSDVPPLLHSQFCLHLWHHRFGGPPNGLHWHLWLRWFKRWIGWANCLWLCRPRCHCCVF